MKTKLLFAVLFMTIGLHAQVGIGTTSPDAQIDVRSSNQATPTTTDGMLIPKVDAFPAANPGVAQQGMLVYLTTAAGVKPPGFYYWNFPTLSWIGITSAISSDKDWLETATGLAPDDINDDMYHMGRAAIGKISPSAPLDVEGTNINSGIISTAFINNNLTAERSGIVSTVSGTSNDNLNGLRQTVSGSGIGIHYGVYNSVSGNGMNYGTYNTVSSAANTTQTGTNNIVTGAGTGQKIGTYNYIDPLAGGTHYGIVSYALKAGSYAGYFQGNVAIGTNAGNHYILPPSRGLNTQIMQTDGAGNVTWQNMGTALGATAWLTTGNSGLASGTNFLGTTDNISVAFRTANLERMRLTNTGQLVINNTIPAVADVFSAYAAGTNYAVNGYATGTGAAGYFNNMGTAMSIYAGKATATGSAAVFQTVTAANTSSTVDVYNQNGTAPALAVRTDSASATADGIEINVYGAAAKRGIEMYVDPAVTGIGVGIFHNGTNRGLNVQQQSTTNIQPAIFGSVAGNARGFNMQNTLATHTTQLGFFSQSSTGLAFPAYDAASAVWGQSLGIRGGTFLAGGASVNTTALEGSYSGPLGNYDGVGVYGSFAPAALYGYGVVGEGNWFGMFALGDSGASGVKAFQIDHPLDPENKYLRHYSMESPEILNMYRGNVILDNNGEAIVTLPSYFEEININFSYHLTAIGAPSNTYIKEEIRGNQFKIAGGNPNQKISWQVFAERNDAYLQQNPEKRKVEMDKKAQDRGLYLQPELYRQPKEKSIFKRYKADPSKGKVQEMLREEQSKPPEIIQKPTVANAEIKK